MTERKPHDRRAATAFIAAALLLIATMLLPLRAAAVEAEIQPADTAAATAAAPIPGAMEATGTVMPGEMPPETLEYDGPREVTVSNDFISIVVNTMPVDTGRFLARTVKGDPTRGTDDNKILIYGGALPWTSFTTFRIDGKNYVFGGSTHRRAGRDALYGEVIDPPRMVGADTIVTRCRMEDLDVTQTLGITSGPVSRLNDTIKVTYTIRNTGAAPRRVGVRAVIDTLLGNNDASPFKVGESNITTETELAGIDILDYWIAFDSLEDPGVVARGTLRGPGLTTPDRVVFANWGKLADNLWDFPYTPGEPFKRENEEAMDSATALYWEETTISPNGEVQYSTLYGMDYLNVTGDILSIGANRHLGEWSTAKNQIRPYTLYAYVANSSQIELNDVLITIDVPEGIELTGKDTGVRRLGKLNPGREVTIGWVVQPKVGAGGDKAIKITGSAYEVESVELETTATLLSPPGIIATVIAPEQVRRATNRDFGPYGPPFPVQLKCRNDGRSPIDNLHVELVLPDGLEFPRIQKTGQSYRRIEGLQEVVFSWKVIATGDRSGDLELQFNITSDSTEDKKVGHLVKVDPLPVAIGWTGVPDETFAKTFFTAELYVMDIDELGAADLSVRYNADVLQVVMVSQGTLFVEKGQPLPWREPEIDNKLGMITGIMGRRATPLDNQEGSLVKVYFQTLAAGESPIDVVDMKLIDLKNKEIEYSLDETTVRVGED